MTNEKGYGYGCELYNNNLNNLRVKREKESNGSIEKSLYT